MGDALTPEDVLEVVRDWFAEVGGASMRLPTGWFGRPYDNLHRLTGSHVLAQRLILVLDDQLILLLAHPNTASTESKSLRISGFAHGSLDWDEYGNRRAHVESFEGGEVEFVAP
jgi:hypothetical protein